MVKDLTIAGFLNRELNVKKIPDSSRNGLQIKTNKEIKKIGFAVDASLSTFKKAKKANIDLLIVHHGIKWKPQKHRELFKRRQAFLKKNKISLYASHLPLDLHQKYGNNIELCRILNLINIKKFGAYHRRKIGYSGKLKKKTNIYTIAETLNNKLHTKSKVYPFGRRKIRSIGIVSGSGSDAIEDAIKEKKDCFLVGEINLGDYNRAKDCKLSVVAAGHYATETLGVKALMPIIKEKFKVTTIFIDNPTGL